MAEIKSTLELVMEKAARIAAKESSPVTVDQLIKKGMRIGAEYMNSKGDYDIIAQFIQLDQEEKEPVLEGCFKTIARNITLPREDDQNPAALKALECLVKLSGNDPSVNNTCGELQQLLEQYLQHKVQVTDQLEGALKQQLEQHAISQGQEPGDVNPKLHPKYSEELGRMISDLNDQYNQAINERKQLIRQAIEI